jgi:DNA mismatch repair ATPase MutS
MMAEQAGSSVYEQLTRKLDILQKISTNTKFQMQFIQQRKMKGLLRLLRERAQYLQEWETIIKETDGAVSLAMADEKIKMLILLIEDKQQEIIEGNDAVIEAAQAEKNHIVANLRRIDAEIKLRYSYDYQWEVFSGNWLNQKG